MPAPPAGAAELFNAAAAHMNAGRFAAAITAGEQFTKQYPNVHWRVLPEPIEVAYCGAGVEKGNEALRIALNQALGRLHRDGVIARTWQHWYGAPMLGAIEAESGAAGADAQPSQRP